MNPKELNLRITQIKVWEIIHKKSFLEIVAAYNAEYGTNHFSEILSFGEK